MKLTHPQSKQTVDVPDGSEGPYLRNGWTVKTPRTKDSGDKAGASTSERGK